MRDVATGGALVELRDVWKSFDRKQVLRGIDLALAKGTILAVMGGSGTGKTVLLRIASGLIYPDSGAVSLFGTRIDRMTEEAMLPVRRRSGLRLPGRGPLRLALGVRERGLSAPRAHPHAAAARSPSGCTTS